MIYANCFEAFKNWGLPDIGGHLISHFGRDMFKKKNHCHVTVVGLTKDIMLSYNSAAI
jgi:hypothetical protein